MKFTLNAIRFEDVRQKTVDYLKENGTYVAEFDYQGSNLSYIIDSMAYSTMLMSYQISLTANNVFLDTTEIRKNAVSIGKTLGYKPKRKIASQIPGTLRYNKSDSDTINWSEDTTITIPVKTLFRGSNENKKFINLDPIVLTYKNPLVLEGSFTLWQGEFNQMEVLGNGTSLQSVVIPSANIEENNLTVSIKQTVGDDVPLVWDHAQTFFGITSENIYFVEEDVVNEFFPKIIFGNGTIGRIPTLQETIVIDYMVTSGFDGDGENEFDIPSEIEDATHSLDLSVLNLDQFEIIISDNTFSFGGTDNEPLGSIQVNAPRYFTAAGRGVTETDFNTVLSSYQDIQSFNVTGGNELYPEDDTQLGKTYISAVPTFEDFFASSQIYMRETDEVGILSNIKNIGIIATKKTFFKPTYIIPNLEPSIEVDVNATLDERRNIRDGVNTALTAHFVSACSSLGPKYRESKIASSMDTVSGVISSELHATYSFAINYDSFYNGKASIMFLPSLKEIDETGNVVLDENDQPNRTPFIKNNASLAESYNNRTGESKTVEDLPVDESSIYGELSHRGRTRTIFSKDIRDVVILQLRNTIDELGVYTRGDNLVYDRPIFVDNAGVEHEAFLFPTAIADEWDILVDARDKIATLYHAGDSSWALKDINTAYLVENLGASMDLSYQLFQGEVSAEEDWDATGTSDTKTQIKIRMTGNMSSVRAGGESSLFDYEWDSTNDEYILTNLQTFYHDDPDGITLEYTTDIPDQAEVTYDGNVLFIFNRNEVGDPQDEITSIDSDNMALVGVKSGLTDFAYESRIEDDIDGNEVTITYIVIQDIFDNSEIGTLRYDNGELNFSNVMKGEKSTLAEDSLVSGDHPEIIIQRTVNVKTFFDEYTQENSIDYIGFKQEDILDDDGNVIDQVTDFDGRFCQFVVPNTATPIIKRV